MNIEQIKIPKNFVLDNLMDSLVDNKRDDLSQKLVATTQTGLRARTHTHTMWCVRHVSHWGYGGLCGVWGLSLDCVGDMCVIVWDL